MPSPGHAVDVIDAGDLPHLLLDGAPPAGAPTSAAEAPGSGRCTSIMGTEICGSSSRGVASDGEPAHGQRGDRDQRRELGAQEGARDPSGDAHYRHLGRGWQQHLLARPEARPAPRPNHPPPGPAGPSAARRRLGWRTSTPVRSPSCTHRRLRHHYGRAFSLRQRQRGGAARQELPRRVVDDRVDRVEAAAWRGHHALDHRRAPARPRCAAATGAPRRSPRGDRRRGVVTLTRSREASCMVSRGAPGAAKAPGSTMRAHHGARERRPYHRVRRAWPPAPPLAARAASTPARARASPVSAASSWARGAASVGVQGAHAPRALRLGVPVAPPPPPRPRASTCARFAVQVARVDRSQHLARRHPVALVAPAPPSRCPSAWCSAWPPPRLRPLREASSTSPGAQRRHAPRHRARRRAPPPSACASRAPASPEQAASTASPPAAPLPIDSSVRLTSILRRPGWSAARRILARRPQTLAPRPRWPA